MESATVHLRIVMVSPVVAVSGTLIELGKARQPVAEFTEPR